MNTLGEGEGGGVVAVPEEPLATWEGDRIRKMVRNGESPGGDMEDEGKAVEKKQRRSKCKTGRTEVCQRFGELLFLNLPDPVCGLGLACVLMPMLFLWRGVGLER